MRREETAGTGGVVRVLHLSHGPLNALDVDLCRELTGRLTAAAGGGAVVLAGDGRAFSAGVDLQRLTGGGAAYLREFLPALEELFRTAFALPVPVVAAVDGAAIAGGAILAAAADVVVASDRAVIGVPELEVGVPLPPAAFEVVRTRVGDARARDVILTGRRHTAEQAVACGLADEVVVGGDVVERAVALAEHLATRGPAEAFTATKDQLRGEAVARIDRTPLEPTLQLWCRSLDEGWTARYLDALRSGARSGPP